MEAMQIYQSLNADRTMIAEVHFYLAEALSARGDIDAAISHSQRSKKIRETILGQHETRTIESYKQVSSLLLFPYKEYKGVVTSQIRVNYLEVISCLEKVFRFMKTSQKPKRKSKSDVNSIISKSTTKSKSEILNTNEQTLYYGKNNSFSGGMFDGKLNIIPACISGPFFSPPFTLSKQPESKIIHLIVKQIVKLKLELLETPKHRECVRTLRQKLYQEQKNNQGNVQKNEAKSVILGLTAVSPSIYLGKII